MNRFSTLSTFTILIVGLLALTLSGCGAAQPAVEPQEQNSPVVASPVEEGDTDQIDRDSDADADTEAEAEQEEQLREIPDAEGEFDPDSFEDDEIDALLEYIDALLSEAEESVNADSTGSAN